jgi:predicted Rossmann fold flavoprotein
MNMYDVIIIGAGAAGLMAASQAAKQGKKTLLIESTNNIGEKIRISGGGRCNFTNINASPINYISNNPHFIKSALARYTQHDFIKLIEDYNISYHEKTLGQLFCDGSSSQIIDLFLNECSKYNVTLNLNCIVSSVTKTDNFIIESNQGSFSSKSLIIATGGLSIPKIGASDFGYKIAKQFDLNIIETKPSLVPLTVNEKDLEFFKSLSGISIDSEVSYKKISFRENILFTHRGLSGPAILQISSYIDPPETIKINLLPDLNLNDLFLKERHSKTSISNFLKEFLPKRFVDNFCEHLSLNKRIIDYKTKDLEQIANHLHQFSIQINSTEGYKKAEVTTGGIDTKELSSKTMAALKVPNLYFIGEVVDVTGWLGGYNFQWAWSSGFVAGNEA